MRRNTALLLAGLLAAGCGTSTRHSLPNEVATQFLFYRGANSSGGSEGEKPRGGLGDLFVEVSANPNYRAPVRFAETTSGGVGDGWRAAVWMALLSASAALDIDPAGIRVSVEADDAVDGPSAGALTTVAIMAAIKGHSMLETAAMTGTINPDLTVGPVGGIPEKVRAAIERGKTRIGIPVGQSTAVSLASRDPVDVRALAKERGAQVFELRDITDAYRVMTGHEMKVPDALEVEEMALPRWVGEVFEAEAARILEQVEASQTDLKALFAQVPDHPRYVDVKRERAGLLAEIERVRGLLTADDPVTAIYSATGLQGWHFQVTTALLMRMGRDLDKWEYVGKLLRNLRLTVAATLESAVPQWQSYVAHDAVEVPFVVDTFEALIHAIRGLTTAQRILSQHTALRRLVQEDGFVPDNDRAVHHEALGELVVNMINAQSNLLLGRAYFAVGQAWLERSRDLRSENPIPSSVIRHVSGQYKRVADANLQYVDALLIQSRAARVKMAPEKARLDLMERDTDYRQAIMNRRLPELMGQKVLSDEEQAYAVLSGAVSSYFASAMVISKRYSLGARFDKRTDRLVRIKHGAALESMLELADRQARQAAASCRGLFEEVPVNALIEYDLGRRLERDSREKEKKGSPDAVRLRLQALGHLWRSYTLGRLAIQTHRRIGETDAPY